MPTLYFSEKHKQLVEELCTSSGDGDQTPIFPKYRDLMLFAAMVGKHMSALVPREGNGGEVESAYFASSSFNKEGVVYLMGILDFRDPDKLRDGAKDCWKQFESYCAGGMEIISRWLSEASGVDEYPELLEENILLVARKSRKVDVTVRKPKKLSV